VEEKPAFSVIYAFYAGDVRQIQYIICGYGFGFANLLGGKSLDS
jgi:hypothetical protein